MRLHATPCSTLPLVIYPNYLYVYGEFFMRTIATLHAMRAKGWISDRCARPRAARFWPPARLAALVAPRPAGCRARAPRTPRLWQSVAQGAPSATHRRPQKRTPARRGGEVCGS